MAGINIRKAVKDDCPRLMELIRGLAEYEKAPHEVTVTMEHFEQSGFGPRPVWGAFVAEHQGRIEGLALYYVRYSTWKGCRLYLEDLYVEPDMRGRGIGALLFERLIAHCRTEGFSGMVWQALEWNEPALNFYSKYDAKIDPEWLNCSIEM